MEHSEEIAQLQLQVQQKDGQVRAANNEKEVILSEMTSKVRSQCRGRRSVLVTLKAKREQDEVLMLNGQRSLQPKVTDNSHKSQRSP